MNALSKMGAPIFESDSNRWADEKMNKDNA